MGKEAVVPLNKEYEIRVLSYRLGKFGKSETSSDALHVKMEVLASFDKVTGARQPLPEPVEDWTVIALSEASLKTGNPGDVALKALGMGNPADYFQETGGTKTIVGNTARAFYNKQKGTQYTQWSFRDGDRKAKPADPAMIRKLASRWSGGKQAPASTQTQVAPPPSPPVSVQPEQQQQAPAQDRSDDDIPF